MGITVTNPSHGKPVCFNGDWTANVILEGGKAPEGMVGHMTNVNTRLGNLLTQALQPGERCIGDVDFVYNDEIPYPESLDGALITLSVTDMNGEKLRASYSLPPRAPVV